MSKKRPTESSWDSDEELLSDTSGITAFPKTSELDLLGDDGELDEDALLGMDEAGAKGVSVSFANDSIRLQRQRSKMSFASRQEHKVIHEEPLEQEFVFEEADTTDLENELNVGGHEEDSSAYHLGDDGYSSGLYHQDGSGDATGELEEDENLHGNCNIGMSHEEGEEMGYINQHEDQVDYGNAMVAYGENDTQDANEGTSGVELDYGQPVEQDEQVHLEYEDSQTTDQGEVSERVLNAEAQGDEVHYESESDSDNEDSRHNRGKFINERTGKISLAATTTRETIPDTLEINKEQAEQIEQYEKSQKGKARGRGRPNVHSRLGMRPGLGPQAGRGGMLQGPRMGPFPRGMLGQGPPLGFPFPGGVPNMHQRGPFQGRGPFPQRGPFMRAPFPEGAPNMQMGGPQRNPFPQGPQARFAGPRQVRGLFTGDVLMRESARMAMLPNRLRNPQVGPQRMGGPPLNQQQALRLRFQLNQKGPGSAQRPQQMQSGMRVPMPGPRPLMGPNSNLMRPGGPVRGRIPSQGQPIPSLVKPVSTQPQALMRPQRTQPGPRGLGVQSRISPHQRLGPMQGQIRPQNPMNSHGPRGPQMLRAGQNQGAMMRRHKIYINPRFQGQQGRPQGGPLGITRTVKMGMPVQQKKAKALLEKALNTQKKVAAPAQATSVAVKRKSTGADDVPVKVMRTVARPDYIGSPKRVVKADSDEVPTSTDSGKISALLEEQRRKRELIQKRKELARQKQAAVKRKELEERLKREGKTIEDVLGGGNTDVDIKEEEQKAVAPVKQISGSVAARLGPPPIQQKIRGPTPQQRPQQPGSMMRPPGQQAQPTFQMPQRFPGAPQRPQQIRGPSPQAQFPNQPRIIVPQDPRMRGPPPSNVPRAGFPINSGQRIQGQQNNQFRAPSPSDPRFRTPPPATEPRFRNPQPNTDPRFRSPPPSGDPRFRGPPPTNDPRFRGHPPQVNILSPPVSQPVRYTAPPSHSQPNTRFQSPQSAPPHVAPSYPTPSQVSRGPPQQQYPPTYPPSNAPTPQPQPHSHYPPPSQTSPAPYSQTGPQYTPPVSSYQPPNYAPPTQQQYQHQPPPHQSPLQHPPPASQHYSQPPASPYQNPPGSQYQNTPAPHYQDQSTQQYQSPSAQQYQSPPSQPYQSQPSQPYQSQPSQTYQSPTPQHYQGQSDYSHQTQQSHYDYYSSPQPIQTITNQAPTPSPTQDQRTVQHQTPVGQQIQTIGQRIQPVTGTQMRSIIQNVSSPVTSPVAPHTSGRLIQPRGLGRIPPAGQVSAMDGPQRILIENVPPLATKETLIKICRHFGQVLGINLIRDQNRAVVQFQTGDQAAKCVAKCDQKCLHKTRLTVTLLPN